MTERNFAPIHEVTMYQARCTSCGYVETEYGDFAAWADEDTARNDVVEAGWFEKFEDGQLVDLLCLSCLKCDVCGAVDARDVNDDEHLVCAEHEDHDFAAAVWT